MYFCKNFYDNNCSYENVRKLKQQNSSKKRLLQQKFNLDYFKILKKKTNAQLVYLLYIIYFKSLTPREGS